LAQRRSTIRRKTQDALVELRDLRSEKRNLEDSISVVQDAALDGLSELGIKSITIDLDTITVLGTRVDGTTLHIDEGKLRKRLGARLWQRVSTRTLDRNKLEALVAAGDIDPRIVAECSEENPKKPYIRITERAKS